MSSVINEMRRLSLYLHFKLFKYINCMQNQLRYEIEKFKQLTIFNGFHGTLAIGYCLCLSHSSCVSVANCCQYPNILNLND